MSDEKPKGPGGRPSKFGTIDLEAAEKLARKGWTDKEMADFFGVALSTWMKWKAERSEFSDALKDWKDEADARVVRSLYERATGYSHPEDKIFLSEGMPVIVPTTKHYPPDATSGIFWLKNRDKENWRDRRETELSGKDGGPIEITSMKDEELARTIAMLAKKAAGE